MLKNKYVTAAVAVLFLLVLAYNLNFFYSKRRPVAAPSVPGAVQIKHTPVLKDKNHERAPEKQDASAWKRDPFGLKTGSGKSESAELQLIGIIKRNGKSHALINGRVYTENQRVGASVIKEIRRQSVVLSTEGTLHELYFDDYKVLKEKTK